jgi:hypothetical protein
MRVRLVRQKPEPPAFLTGMSIQQRHQLRVVTGLTRSQSHRDHSGAFVGQGMDFRGQPTP